MKRANKPHAKRRKRHSLLNNNNPPFYLTNAPRCGAKTRKGTPCKSPAMKNGRCRMHGGKSTGPKTLEGLERSRRANWKHGYYSQEASEERRMLRQLLKMYKEDIKDIGN